MVISFIHNHFQKTTNSCKGGKNTLTQFINPEANKPKPLPALLSISKTAEVMGVSRDYVYKALRDGDLETAEIAGKRWILRDPLLKKLGIA